MSRPQGRDIAVDLQVIIIIISVMVQQEAPGTGTPPRQQAVEGPDTRQLDSRTLLGSERELLIHHNGELYRLRLTRAGKLILTK